MRLQLNKIEVIQSAGMDTILGKFPAIFNGHEPPRGVYPYVKFQGHTETIGAQLLESDPQYMF